MMLLATMLMAASAPSAVTTTTIGSWRVRCEKASFSEPLYDRCIMTTKVENADVEVIRTYARAEFRARLKGCKAKGVLEPEVRTRDQLESDGASLMFVGGVIGSFIRASRACSRPPAILEVGQEDVPALLAATSGLRAPPPSR